MFQDMKQIEVEHEQNLQSGGVCGLLYHFARRCENKIVESECLVGQKKERRWECLYSIVLSVRRVLIM